MDIRDAKKIVVLNLIPRTLGDSLYIISLLRILRKNVPDAHIALTCAPLTYDLLRDEPTVDEFKVLPDLDKIAEKVSPFNKARTYVHVLREAYKFIKTGRFDACIVGLPLFWPASLVPWLAHVPIRIGYRYKGNLTPFLLTHKAAARGATENGEKTLHFVELYLELCRSLGFSFDRDDVRIRFTPTEKDVSIAQGALDGLRPARFVAFQAGSKGEHNQWPEERYIELGKRILAHHDMHLLLTGSPSERALNDRIKAGIGDRCTNIAGIGIGPTAAALKRCRMLIGNTSGILHLASAVGIPTIGLHWFALPSQSEPIGMGRTISIGGSGYCDKCKPGPVWDHGCKHSVSVDDVSAVFEKEFKTL